jgi:hypothetical protein
MEEEGDEYFDVDSYNLRMNRLRSYILELPVEIAGQLQAAVQDIDQRLTGLSGLVPISQIPMSP